MLLLWWLYRGGFLNVLFGSFSEGPRGLLYVFIIAVKVTTLEPAYSPTFVDHGSLSLGETSRFLMVLLPLKCICIPYLQQISLMLSQETLGVWYYYMTLSFSFIGNVLGTCSTLAVNPILNLPGWPGKSFLHLVQSLFGVYTIGKCFPEMLHFFLEKLRIVVNNFGPMGESTNDTVFSWEMMVAVPTVSIGPCA